MIELDPVNLRSVRANFGTPSISACLHAHWKEVQIKGHTGELGRRYGIARMNKRNADVSGLTSASQRSSSARTGSRSATSLEKNFTTVLCPLQQNTKMIRSNPCLPFLAGDLQLYYCNKLASCHTS